VVPQTLKIRSPNCNYEDQTELLALTSLTYAPSNAVPPLKQCCWPISLQCFSIDFSTRSTSQ